MCSMNENNKKTNQLTSCGELCDQRNNRMKNKNMKEHQIYQDTGYTVIKFTNAAASVGLDKEELGLTLTLKPT